MTVLHALRDTEREGDLRWTFVRSQYKFTVMAIISPAQMLFQIKDRGEKYLSQNQQN